MPRIPPSQIHIAASSHAYLPLLLRVTHSLPLARSELRWLTAHAHSRATPFKPWQTLLKAYVLHRSRHVPLQYILGSEFFGPLEIKCRKGVLVPRGDTAAVVEHLAALLAEGRTGTSLVADGKLRVLDLCTGTGCIALLLAHLLPRAEVLGVDVSSAALELARENARVNVLPAPTPPTETEPGDVDGAGTQPEQTTGSSQLSEQAHKQDPIDANAPPEAARLNFLQADILAPSFRPTGRWDVLVSNPPYISDRDMKFVTARSVGRYEPALALRGGETGDVFYPVLLQIAERTGTKVVLLEVGDEAQARRVLDMAGSKWKGEMWTEDPASGQGKVRAVYLTRQTWVPTA